MGKNPEIFISSKIISFSSETLKMHLAVGILRVEEGLDISSLIEDEGQVALRRINDHHKKHMEMPKIVQNDVDGTV